MYVDDVDSLSIDRRKVRYYLLLLRQERQEKQSDIEGALSP